MPETTKVIRPAAILREVEARRVVAALTGLEAPDFALPDISGVEHRLSDLRGQKVFLTTWASW